MRLGLDLLFLVPGVTGGREIYTRELLRAMRAARPDLHVTAFVNADTVEAGPGWWSEGADRTVALRRVRATSAPSWALGELAALPVAVARAGVDLVHAPANFAPVVGSVPRVVTLHDLLFRELPELHAPLMRWGTEAMVPLAARRATRVLTGTRWAAGRIASELGVPLERVDVVPHGVNRPRAAGDARAARERIGAGGRRIVLAVATHLPHKNHAALVAALATLDPAERPLLVVVGAGTDAPELRAEAERLGVSGDVALLGGVPGVVLEDLWAAADVYATATLHEGFGLPVLEAMARDVPVVASDLPVLREVGGEAALHADPGDPRAFGAALRRAIGDHAEGERLRERGRTCVAQYSWDRAARGTLAAYERALEDAARAGRGPSRPAAASR